MPTAMDCVWRDGTGEARGMIRLLPTVLPCMLESYRPHLYARGELPRSAKGAGPLDAADPAESATGRPKGPA